MVSWRRQVRTTTSAVAQSGAGVSAADRALVTSRTAYDGEEQRMRAGVSTPYRVMLALRDYMAAASADVQARVNYAKSLVAYQVAVGSFLEENGIDANEALRGTLLTDRNPR
jgi:outer membrane protein TolC